MFFMRCTEFLLQLRFFIKCQMIGSYRSPNGQTYIDRTAERAEGRKRYDLYQYRIRSPNRYFLFQASADCEAVFAFCRRAAYCRVSKRKLRCDSEFNETHMKLIKRITNKAFGRDRSRMVASSSRFFVRDLGNRGENPAQIPTKPFACNDTLETGVV